MRPTMTMKPLRNQEQCGDIEIKMICGNLKFISLQYPPYIPCAKFALSHAVSTALPH